MYLSELKVGQRVKWGKDGFGGYYTGTVLKWTDRLAMVEYVDAPKIQTVHVLIEKLTLHSDYDYVNFSNTVQCSVTDTQMVMCCTVCGKEHIPYDQHTYRNIIDAMCHNCQKEVYTYVEYLKHKKGQS